MSSVIKPNYDDNRQVLADVVPLETPFALQITASSICNFKCHYCIQASDDMQDRRMMEWSVFEKLCNQIAAFDNPLKQITMAGWGEPLANKDMPRMISLIRKMNIANRTSIVTNGSLLKPDFVLSLVEAGVDFIKISLQGITAEKYARVCGTKINFDDLIRKIEFLYKNKGRTEVYIKIADIALDEGEEELFYATFKNITDRMYVESILPIFGNNSEELQRPGTISKYGQTHPPVIVCPQPFYMMNITSAGDVLPCCAYYDPTHFGNISEKPLRSIWDSEKMKRFRLMMLSGKRNSQNQYPACCGCTIPDVIILPGDELDSCADKIIKRMSA